MKNVLVERDEVGKRVRGELFFPSVRPFAARIRLSLPKAANPGINWKAGCRGLVEYRKLLGEALIVPNPSPFLVGVRIVGFVRRWRSRELPYNEVCEGLYVGGWPSSLDRVPSGAPAIIDCTCELPRISALSKNPYICIPTWDTRAPQPSEIESAVRWALRMRSQKRPVYIHCAYGPICHGRSVAVTCATLVGFGVAEDWKQAEKIIRERRPCIRMNALHRRTLEEWSKFRLSPKANGESNLGSVIRSGAS
ncbi:hypothetical protein ACLOJK_031346 [Asimina triloba]